MRQILSACVIIAQMVSAQFAVAENETIRAMTFNIRYGTAPDGDHVWPKRKALLFDVIREHNPQILGMQETLREQLDEILEAFPQYSSLGVGRDADGGGEYSPILFDRTRFDVLESQTFWLSETPTVRGSRGWGANFSRICTRARFVDRSNNRVFRIYNTHWDHQSQPSRLRSGELIAKRLGEIEPTEPLIVMGDFNIGPHDPAREHLTEAGLRDSFEDLKPKDARVGTYHGFTGEVNGDKIDAVLVSREWGVLDAEIVRTERSGLFPSDHFPVTATLELKTTK